MRIDRPLLEATFVVRENRFRARALLAGKEVSVHVPNSGRLTELLLPHQPVLLREAGAPHRLTDYDLLMVRLPDALVSVDARLPNQLFAEALGLGTLADFEGLTLVRTEFVVGGSRLDFLLRAETSGELCVVEVKSVTLVQQGVARFPDAVTQRGSRHLRDLRRARVEGYRAGVVFVIQREDARLFAPHDESDPDFGAVLRQVVEEGVEVHAYTCQVSRQEVTLDSPVPVVLSTGEKVRVVGRRGLS